MSHLNKNFASNTFLHTEINRPGREWRAIARARPHTPKLSEACGRHTPTF